MFKTIFMAVLIFAAGSLYGTNSDFKKSVNEIGSQLTTWSVNKFVEVKGIISDKADDAVQKMEKVENSKEKSKDLN